jgi:cardiolipin synthase
VSASESSLWIAGILILVDLVVRVLAIIFVPRNRRPGSAMAWLLAIFFIPYIGVIFYLLIGSPRLGRKRRAKQDEINGFIKRSTADVEFRKNLPAKPDWLAPIIELNRTLGAMPIIGENAASLRIDYDQNIIDMAADIDKAKRFVHIEYYILANDSVTKPFFDAMERAVQRGVKVRVLFDHVAALRTVGYRKTKKKLTAIGAEWHLMLPFLMEIKPFREINYL